MKSKRIFCPNGHLVGIETENKLIVKHSGRVVTVYKTETPTSIEIQCDECKERRKIKIFANLKENT